MEELTTYYERFETRSWRTGYAPFDTAGVAVIPFYQRRSRNSNPSWREQVARKSNATTPYSRMTSNMTETLRSKIAIRYKTAGSIPTEVGIHQPIWNAVASPSWPDVCSPKAINQALGYFLNQINDLNSPLKGGVVVGELRKTLKTIAHPFTAAYYLFRSYRYKADAITRRWLYYRNRKVRKKGLRAANKQLASLWLEYSFGIQPLVNDVKKAIIAYERWCEEFHGITPIWGTGTDESLSSQTSPYNVEVSQKIATTGIYKSIIKSSCRFKGEYGYRIGAEGPVDRAKQLCGFTLSEFIPTLWELLPFSWLADYFTNIGTIITAMHTAVSNVLWYCRTDRAIRVQTWTARCDWAKIKSRFPADAYVAIDQQGSMVMETKSLVRSVPPLGVPGLFLKIPGLTTQWANMLAVLTRVRR